MLVGVPLLLKWQMLICTCPSTFSRCGTHYRLGATVWRWLYQAISTDGFCHLNPIFLSRCIILNCVVSIPSKLFLMDPRVMIYQEITNIIYLCIHHFGFILKIGSINNPCVKPLEAAIPTDVLSDVLSYVG